MVAGQDSGILDPRTIQPLLDNDSNMLRLAKSCIIASDQTGTMWQDIKQLANEGDVLQRQGDVEGAISAFVDILRVLDKEFGSNHPCMVPYLKTLATLHMMRQDFNMAKDLLLRTLFIEEETASIPALEVASTLNSLSALCIEIGNYKEAMTLVRRAVAIFESSTDKSASYVKALTNLGICLLHDRKGAEAHRLFEKALDYSKSSSTDPLDLVPILVNLVSCVRVVLEMMK